MKAVCTWGEGPDVMLCLEGTPLILGEHPDLSHFSYGVVTKGDLDLTADQAQELGLQLIKLAQQAKDLYEGIKEQDEKRNSRDSR